MRHWIGVVVLLVIISLAATFVVAGVAPVVGTASALQRTDVSMDDLGYAEMLAECE